MWPKRERFFSRRTTSGQRTPFSLSADQRNELPPKWPGSRTINKQLRIESSCALVSGVAHRFVLAISRRHFSNWLTRFGRAREPEPNFMFWRQNKARDRVLVLDFKFNWCPGFDQNTMMMMMMMISWQFDRYQHNQKGRGRRPGIWRTLGNRLLLEPASC